MSLNTTITLLAERGQKSAWLPTDRFCVRKTSAVFAQGKVWIYADVVPWDNPYWPNTYDTTIHAFSSLDCRTFIYHGEILPRGAPGHWDAGGVATPGAVVHDGTICLFYSGREKTDGTGTRYIGLAVAANPAGPFRKLSEPALTSDGHLDDPCPILSPDRQGIDLYFRRAMHHLTPPNYSIRLSRSADHGATWSNPIAVLCADGHVRAYETAEAKRLACGQVLLAVFEHFTTGGIKTGFWVSRDSVCFKPCDQQYLEDHACCGWAIPKCGLQPCLIGKVPGVYDHLGIAQPVDSAEHYNIAIHPIRPLSEIAVDGAGQC